MNTMDAMRELQVATVVELGPSRMLASLANKNIPNVETWTADELFNETAGSTSVG
jgi:malonyl CoA-acyl carrier protein transacylase